MNTLRLKDFSVFVTFSEDEFSLKKGKNSLLTLSDKETTYQFQLKQLQERIKFILSLACDCPTDVSIRVCGLNEITTQNTYYRKKNYATDVLSFPARIQGQNSKTYYLGDILICLPVCQKQAKSARVTLSQELEKMLIHGIVHLKGFDHETGSNHARVMTTLEKALKKELESEMAKPEWCSIVHR